MRKTYLGSINYRSSPSWQNFFKGVFGCLVAQNDGASVIEVINLSEGVDMGYDASTIAQSRAEQSRAEQSRAEQSRVSIIGTMDNRLDNTYESANRVYDSEGLSPTIPTCSGGGIQPKVIEMKKVTKIGFVDNGSGEHQSNTVYSTDGVSPGITTIHGGTQQIKICDAQALRMVRTEEGKALRKDYESGKIHHAFREYSQPEPRNDDVSNTVTTVQKDNHIIETKQVGYIEKGTVKHQSNMVFDSDGLCPCICAGMGVKQQPTMTVEQKIVARDFVMDGNFNQRGKVHPENGVCRTIMGSGHEGNEPKVLTTRQIVAMRGRNPDNPSDRTAGIPTEQRLEANSQDICNTLTTVQKDNLVLEKKTVKTIKIKQATKDGFAELEIGGVVDLDYPDSKTRRGRVIDNGRVSPTTTTTTRPYVVELANPEFYSFLYEIDGELYLIRIRKLIPLECFRLMGVSNTDAKKMLSINSRTQCYKQAGNSIITTVLMAVFSQLNLKGVRKWNDMSEDEIWEMIRNVNGTV